MEKKNMAELSDLELIAASKMYLNECFRRLENKVKPITVVSGKDLKEKIKNRLLFLFEKTLAEELYFSCSDILEFIIPEHPELLDRNISKLIRNTFSMEPPKASRYNLVVYINSEVVIKRKVGRAYTFKKQDVLLW